MRSPVHDLAAGEPGSSDMLECLRERMVGFVASRFGRDIAEDLAQEVLVLLQSKYPHVSQLEEVVPLAFKILRFKLSGHHRTSHRRGEPWMEDAQALPLRDEAPDPLAVAERNEMLARLLRGIQGMPDRCRTLFRLKLQGHDFPTIQKLIGAKTLNTVYTWDHRCRKDLLARVGGRWAS